MTSRHRLRARRAAAAAAAAALVGGLGAVIAPANATAGFEFDRLAGSDRYRTAAAIAIDTFASADTAVIATGENFPDALAGSYLAGGVQGPLLLVQHDSVPPATSDALEDLGVQSVYILGRSGVVSEAVEQQLVADGYAVERIGGLDRFSTARDVALELGAAAVGEIDGDRTAIVANGFGYADALAAGPVAYAGELPLLLTGPAGLASPARDALEQLAIDHVVIVGGENVVQPQVKSDIEAMGITTERVSGANRFATAVAMADWAIDNVVGFGADHVNLAKGVEPGNPFADALAGGPHGGEEGAPTLLVAPETLPAETRTWLEANAETLTDGHIFGGTSAVSTAVENGAEAAARNVPGEVVRTDGDGNTYTYVPAGADTAQVVGYTADDRFFVDGAPATIGAFESHVDPGDRVQFVSGSTPVHRLDNVSDSAINGRTIGNVDIADNQFDFINDVTGDWVRRNVTYAGTGHVWKIGATEVSETTFEADLNEGDVVTISADGKTFTLTNKAVTGVANQIEKPTGQSYVRLRIDVYGDIPGASSDSSTDTAGSGNDDKFRADGPTNVPPSDGDTYTGDASTFSAFHSQLTPGDVVTYTRVGGVETFELDNRPLATVEGAAVELSADGDGNPITNSGGDGGVMTLRHDDGSEADHGYKSGGTFVVDGLVSTEAEFEDQFSEGDRVVYTPADPDANQAQRIELTNVAQ